MDIVATETLCEDRFFAAWCIWLYFASNASVQVHSAVLNVLLVKVLKCQHFIRLYFLHRVPFIPTYFKHFQEQPYRFVIFFFLCQLLSYFELSVNQKGELICVLCQVCHKV